MIDADELKPGNYVLRDGKLKAEIVAKHYYKHGRCYVEFEDGQQRELDNLQPIPLDPEILKKLNVDITFYAGYVVEKDKEGKWFSSNGKGDVINSLHQFQNHYLQKTGQELNLK